MNKRTKESNEQARNADEEPTSRNLSLISRANFRDRSGLARSLSVTAERELARLLCLMEKCAGAVLGSVAVSVQFSNVLICLFMLILGPAVIINWLTR